MTLNIYDEMIRREMVEQSTNEQKVRELLGGSSVSFYIGYDATADSLHAGHFVQLSIMRMLQKAGHHPIVLIGGGTTKVGDPTGKTDMRTMMTNETINYNVERFRIQMAKFLDLTDNKTTFVNNDDWLSNLNYIDFIREYGIHFSVNRMLAAEAFKQRMERGLSFFELNYMIMQSYDFLHLFRTQNCIMQLGGNDQWSNIIAGVELIRKVEEKEAYGLTFKLLTTKEGIKMGKTSKGAVWLDPNKTSPYEFYQYWRNIADSSVTDCMKLLTEIPIEEIEEIDKLSGENLNEQKERLAYLLTSLIHSEEDAILARNASRALFMGSGDIEGMPLTELCEDDFNEIDILDLLMKCKLTASRGEGRRLIEQSGISIDDKKIEDIAFIITKDFIGEGIIIKKGKKVYHRVVVIE